MTDVVEVIEGDQVRAQDALREGGRKGGREGGREGVREARK